jgi:hypothetical protein
MDLCGGRTRLACPHARSILGEAYRGDPEALHRLMLTLLVRATVDLCRADPTRLYHRFVGWTLERDEVCRVCYKPRHTVLAGVPPRLFPCATEHDRQSPARLG